MQFAVHAVMVVSGGTIYCIPHCRVQYITYCLRKHRLSKLYQINVAPDLSGLCEAWVEWISGGGGDSEVLKCLTSVNVYTMHHHVHYHKMCFYCQR